MNCFFQNLFNLLLIELSWLARPWRIGKTLQSLVKVALSPLENRRISYAYDLSNLFR